MNTTLINNLLLLGVMEIIKIIVENIGTIADPEDDVISFVIVISTVIDHSCDLGLPMEVRGGTRRG